MEPWKLALSLWGALSLTAVVIWVSLTCAIFRIGSLTFMFATSAILIGFCAVVALAAYWELEDARSDSDGLYSVPWL